MSVGSSPLVGGMVGVLWAVPGTPASSIPSPLANGSSLGTPVVPTPIPSNNTPRKQNNFSLVSGLDVAGLFGTIPPRPKNKLNMFRPTPDRPAYQPRFFNINQQVPPTLYQLPYEIFDPNPALIEDIRFDYKGEWLHRAKGLKTSNTNTKVYVRHAYRQMQKEVVDAIESVRTDSSQANIDAVTNRIKGVNLLLSDEMVVGAQAIGYKQAVADVLDLIGREGRLGIDKVAVMKELKRRQQEQDGRMLSVKSDTPASKVPICPYAWWCPGKGENGCPGVHPGEAYFLYARRGPANVMCPKCNRNWDQIPGGVEWYGDKNEP
ncbi:hypothetical protein HK097_001237, partial [Rhizophlyctis rosea]